MIEETEDIAVTNESEKLSDGENVAIRAFQKTRCEHAPTWVLGGVVGGLLTSIFINAQAGLCIAAMSAGTSFLNTLNQGNRRLKILQGDAPITSVMTAELLEDYKTLTGEEEFNNQLDLLSESKLELSKDVQQAVQVRKIENDSKNLNPDEELAACYSQCCLILASPGSGKDYLCSNALRKAKQQNPNLKIYTIDPKGLPYEANYYKGFVDYFDSRQCARMSDKDVTSWVKLHIEEFQKLSEDPSSSWLFVVTEATLTGGAFDRLGDDYLAEFTSKFTLTANGYGNALWFLAQFPNLKNLGLSNEARSNLQVFAIVTNDTVNRASQWVRSKVIPKIKENDLRIMCQRSEVNRAFYSPVSGRWGIMPKLHNYSGYDRDSRKFLQQPKPQEQEPKDQHQAQRRAEPEQDKYEEVFSKLLQSSSNDIAIAIQQIDSVDENQLPELITKIKNQALRRNRIDIIKKFNL